MDENNPPEATAEQNSEDKTPAKREKVYKDDEELDDTIFIRNVARFDTTQESLKAHMETNWGETAYCLLCKDRETGESKGTAFVKFKDPESAGLCLGDFEDREMQQKFFLDGRNLFVLPALNRNQMGEVKRASAKKEDEPKEKKVKKPRWYRTPANKNSDDTSNDQKPHKSRGPLNGKGKGKNKLGDSPKRNQMASKTYTKQDKRGKGRRPASKGGRGKKASNGKGGNAQVKGQPQKKNNKKKMMGSDKKVKKTKKVKRKS